MSAVRDRQADALTSAFHALADPFRWQVMQMAAERGQLGMGELAEVTQLSKPSVSYHVKVLREANLITVVKSGRERFITANQRQLRAVVGALGLEADRLSPAKLTATA